MILGRVVKLLSHIVKNTFNEASNVDLDLTEMVNQNVEVRFLEARDKGQFLTLEMNAIFGNLRKIEMALNLEFKVEILNANQQINQLQRNSFQWYHEDSLPMQVVNAVQPLRPQVLNDLKNCVSALATTQKVFFRQIHLKLSKVAKSHQSISESSKSSNF